MKYAPVFMTQNMFDRGLIFILRFTNRCIFLLSLPETMRESQFVDQNREKWEQFESDLRSGSADPHVLRNQLIEHRVIVDDNRATIECPRSPSDGFCRRNNC